MKKLNLIGIFVALILIMVTSVSAVDITAETTISAPGTYDVINDFTGNIIINSDDVVLNVGGHTITGSLIFNMAVSNIEVNNGVFTSSVNVGSTVDGLTLEGINTVSFVLTDVNDLSLNNFGTTTMIGATDVTNGVISNGVVSTNLIFYQSANSNVEINNVEVQGVADITGVNGLLIIDSEFLGSNLAIRLKNVVDVQFEGTEICVDRDNISVAIGMWDFANSNILDTSVDNIGWFPNELTMVQSTPFDFSYYHPTGGYDLGLIGDPSVPGLTPNPSKTYFLSAGNSAPVINSISPNTRVELTSGDSQIYTSDVTDDDADAVYSWTLGGIEVSTSSSYTAVWSDITPGIYTLQLEVSDSEYSDTASTTLEIRARGGSGSTQTETGTETEQNEDSNEGTSSNAISPKTQNVFERMWISFLNFFGW